jgi:hypothetical protein
MFTLECAHEQDLDEMGVAVYDRVKLVEEDGDLDLAASQVRSVTKRWR